MARNTMRLDTTGFERMIVQLDAVGADVKEAVENALGQASETIMEDTYDAIAKQNLPALGKYSQGDTRESVITDHEVRWEGTVGWVPIGFDFGKVGSGGWLITGTPKMKPDMVLKRMYKQKKYMSQIAADIDDVLSDYLMRKMEED